MSATTMTASSPPPPSAGGLLPPFSLSASSSHPPPPPTSNTTAAQPSRSPTPTSPLNQHLSSPPLPSTTTTTAMDQDDELDQDAPTATTTQPPLTSTRSRSSSPPTPTALPTLAEKEEMRRRKEIERQERVDKVLRRAEIAKITRNFQNRLALASFKMIRGWQDVALDQIEPHLEQEALRRKHQQFEPMHPQQLQQHHAAPPPPLPQHYPPPPQQHYLPHQPYSSPHPQHMYQQVDPMTNGGGMVGDMGPPPPGSLKRPRTSMGNGMPVYEQQQPQQSPYGSPYGQSVLPQPMYQQVDQNGSMGPPPPGSHKRPRNGSLAMSGSQGQLYEQPQQHSPYTAYATPSGTPGPSSVGMQQSYSHPGTMGHQIGVPGLAAPVDLGPADGGHGGRPIKRPQSNLGSAPSSAANSPFLTTGISAPPLARSQSHQVSSNSSSLLPSNGSHISHHQIHPHHQQQHPQQQQQQQRLGPNGAPLTSSDPSFTSFVDAATALTGLARGPSDPSLSPRPQTPPPPTSSALKKNGYGAVDGSAEGAAELMLFLAASPSPVQIRSGGPTTTLGGVNGDMTMMKGRRLFSNGSGGEARGDPTATSSLASVFGDLGGGGGRGREGSTNGGGGVEEPSKGLYAPSTPGRERQVSFGSNGAWESFLNVSPSPGRASLPRDGGGGGGEGRVLPFTAAGGATGGRSDGW